MLRFLLCLCFFLCDEGQPQQVSTNLGILNGKWLTSRSGNKYLAFYGIPYAKPPLGSLRFKDPVEYGSWRGLRDATKVKDPCVQWPLVFGGYQNTTGNEDCLYLNIYTPDTKFGSLLPVMVYFHGGAYAFGDSVRNHGATYWMDEKVIVVTIAYRLGPFGFLSFEDDEQPGNMGMKDQLLGLKWVRQNIPAFGGHPKRITIMGESSGGASVNFHMLSPRSKGLFQYAISMSGTSYAPWTIVRSGVARDRAIKVSEIAGCSRNSTRQTVECLRTKDAYSLTDITRDFTNELKDPLTFYGPVVDGQASKPFLPKDPNELTQADVPWLIGFASAEGELKTAVYPTVPSFSWSELDSNFSGYLDSAMWFNYPPGTIKINGELRQFYFGDQPLSDNSYQNMSNLFTDGLFFSPTLQAVRRHSGSVYLYYFDYVGENSFADLIGSRVANGSCHTDEDIYLWEINLFPPLKGDDVTFSKNLVKLWTNFAKTGNPTTRDSVLNWEKYEKQNRYLDISNEGFTLQGDLLDERNRFWSSRFP